MRILYVWDSDYPWDVRTEKICLALTRAGHEVVISARNLGRQPRSERIPEGIVERLPFFGFPGGRHLSFPAFLNPLWLAHLEGIVRRHRIDLILCRDLPLGPAALLVSNRRWPVVMDMAENYPAMIADIWSDGRAGGLDLLIRNPSLVAAVERWALPRFDHVLTVVEESSDRVRELGVDPDRISVVSNTPSLDRLQPLRPRTEGDTLRVVYLGLMEHHRGVSDVLEAVARLVSDGVKVRCDIIGDGRDLDEFRRRALALNLGEPSLMFHGRLAHPDAIRIVNDAHIGLVPHRATPSWNTTISNKLFDYMAGGLAVVTSDAVPSARVVRETGAGTIFRAGDASQLARAIRQLLDISFWEQCRRQGQEAIRRQYHWEKDSRVLLDVVQHLANRDNGAAAIRHQPVGVL